MLRYSWECMSRLFKNLVCDIGVYDFSKPVLENTEPVGTIKTSLKTLFDGDTSKFSHMQCHP